MWLFTRTAFATTAITTAKTITVVIIILFILSLLFRAPFFFIEAQLNINFITGRTSVPIVRNHAVEALNSFAILAFVKPRMLSDSWLLPLGFSLPLVPFCTAKVHTVCGHSKYSVDIFHYYGLFLK